MASNSGLKFTRTWRNPWEGKRYVLEIRKRRTVPKIKQLLTFVLAIGRDKWYILEVDE